jgi:hypothetical protein
MAQTILVAALRRVVERGARATQGVDGQSIIERMP